MYLAQQLPNSCWIFLTPSVEYHLFSIPTSALQSAKFSSRLQSFFSTSSSKNNQSQPAPNSVVLSEITTYLWVTLLPHLRLCNRHYFIGCPGRTLIGQSCSVHFTQFSSCRFLVEFEPLYGIANCRLSLNWPANLASESFALHVKNA